MDSIEYRSGMEFRVSGRRLEGVALRYGEPARDRDELFLPGSLAPVPPSVPLNLQHDQSLQVAAAELQDGPDALRMVAELPENSGAWSLVNRGALGGLSIEFRARQEHTDGSTRVVEAAELVGLALVDEGAYDTAIEARVKTLPMTGLMRYDQTRTVAQRGRRRKLRHGPGWTEIENEDGSLGGVVWTIDAKRLEQLVKAEVDRKYRDRDIRLATEREVDLRVGRSRTAPGSVIASVLGGTLDVWATSQGLKWATRGKLPETQALREVDEQLQAGLRMESHPIYLPNTARADNGIRVIPEPGNPDVDIEIVESGVLTGIALYPAASPIAGSAPDVELAARRRRAIWSLV